VQEEYDMAAEELQTKTEQQPRPWDGGWTVATLGGGALIAASKQELLVPNTTPDEAPETALRWD